MNERKDTSRSDRAIWIALGAAAALIGVAGPAMYLMVPGVTVVLAARVVILGALLLAMSALLIVGVVAETRTMVGGTDADADARPADAEETFVPLARAA